MASSGSINMVGADSSPRRSIAAELGQGAPVSLISTPTRSLTGIPAGAITMPGDFYGKTYSGTTLYSFNEYGSYGFVVPSGSSSISILLIGGGGGGGGNGGYGTAVGGGGSGGQGGQSGEPITATITVSPGWVINMSVGTGGIAALGRPSVSSFPSTGYTGQAGQSTFVKIYDGSGTLQYSYEARGGAGGVGGNASLDAPPTWALCTNGGYGGAGSSGSGSGTNGNAGYTANLGGNIFTVSGSGAGGGLGTATGGSGGGGNGGSANGTGLSGTNGLGGGGGGGGAQPAYTAFGNNGGNGGWGGVYISGLGSVASVVHVQNVEVFWDYYGSGSSYADAYTEIAFMSTGTLQASIGDSTGFQSRYNVTYQWLTTSPSAVSTATAGAWDIEFTPTASSLSSDGLHTTYPAGGGYYEYNSTGTSWNSRHHMGILDTYRYVNTAYGSYSGGANLAQSKVITFTATIYVHGTNIVVAQNTMSVGAFVSASVPP